MEWNQVLGEKKRRSPVDIIYICAFGLAQWYAPESINFDKVPHQRLIPKLKSHGIRISIPVINWIEQWLTDRRQRVVVDGEVSNLKPVLSRVQGSVLGP